MKLYVSAAAAGWVGVQLFFVLSGLLITGILLDTRTSPQFFRRFYARRTLRIFPLYYALLALVVFIAAPLSWSPNWAASVREHQWAFWLYLSNWGEPLGVGIHGLSHLWSLAVEEQFYLLWPLLVWWLGERGLLRLAVIMVIAGPAIRYGLHSNGLPPLALYSFTIARMDALAVGAILAICLRQQRLRAQLFTWLPEATAVILLAMIALIVRQHGFHFDELPVQLAGQTMAALLSACFLAWLAPDAPTASPRLTRAMSAPVLRDVGKYSYAMYLIHVPIYTLLLGPYTSLVRADDGVLHLPRIGAFTLFVLTISYVLARVTWRFIEAPALRFKERHSLGAGVVDDHRQPAVASGWPDPKLRGTFTSTP